MKWGYGGDGYGVMEGMRHRERDRNIGTQTCDLKERRQNRVGSKRNRMKEDRYTR